MHGTPRRRRAFQALVCGQELRGAVMKAQRGNGGCRHRPCRTRKEENNFRQLICTTARSELAKLYRSPLNFEAPRHELEKRELKFPSPTSLLPFSAAHPTDPRILAVRRWIGSCRALRMPEEPLLRPPRP